MKNSEINREAEKIGLTIYKAIGSRQPSILELIKWIEENFGIRIRVGSGKSGGFHEISGLSGLEYFDPSIGAYRVWYRESDSDGRQNFTIVHEIGHIFLNSPVEKFGYHDGNVYDRKGQERFCNRFAAAFLMPRELFFEKWNELGDDATFKKLRMVAFFRVSGEAVHWRAKELGLLI